MEPDVNQQILKELQNVRRLTTRGLIAFLLLFALFVMGAFWVPRREGAYADTYTAFRALDYRRAAQLPEKLVADHPQDYSLHSYLGSIYLRSGDLVKAEGAYARSYALYPSEETGKILTAIRKARSEQTSLPNPPAGITPSAQPTP
jgi:predicted Zn-dependent protease